MFGWLCEKGGEGSTPTIPPPNPRTVTKHLTVHPVHVDLMLRQGLNSQFAFDTPYGYCNRCPPAPTWSGLSSSCEARREPEHNLVSILLSFYPSLIPYRFHSSICPETREFPRLHQASKHPDGTCLNNPYAQVRHFGALASWILQLLPIN
ncbi:hypothetical protein N658DRAFT_494607 [Parathielavia hyrcaniae]|uniref:Uncharacterized protein n=1 Tax=Parathielavia hyrcaniae TaxID=113614 RepID=A0AAN6Q6U4_9PEZI|nr:hypothetical protein N658DRAFT_494607 [Parathielavia hyrcaniae]